MKKVNIYYKDKNNKLYYLWSTNQFVTVQEAVKEAKKSLTVNKHYKKAYSKKIGENIVLKRIKGSFK